MERDEESPQDWNQEASWVVLEHGERFSPTQFLAFPFDESSSSGSQESDNHNRQHNNTEEPRHQLTRRHSHHQHRHMTMTPALTLFNSPFPGEPTPTGLTPGIALDIPANATEQTQQTQHRQRQSRFSPTYSLHSETGQRMLEAENRFSLMNLGLSGLSKSSSDSLSSNSDERDNEISAILQATGHPRRASSFEGMCRRLAPGQQETTSNPPLPMVFLNRPKSASDQIEKLVEEIKNQSASGNPINTFRPQDDSLEATNFVGFLKQKQKERLERQKEKKRQQQISETLLRRSLSSDPNMGKKSSNKGDSSDFWLSRQWRTFLKLVADCTVPFTMTHLLAILLGVYIGKNAVRK